MKSTRKICSGRKKNNGTTARKREKNSKNRIRQSGKKRTTCSEKEMCGTMHGGELHQMNHTVVVEEKSVHREEGSEEQEGYGHQESERTKRQERQEATPPDVGVARIRMSLFLCTQRLRASVLLFEPKYTRENMRVLCDCGRCTVHTLVACAEKRNP